MPESPAWFCQKGRPWVFCLAFKAAALPARRAGAGWQCNRGFHLAGAQRLLQDVTLALLRNPEYRVYGNGEVGQVGFPVAEATFNRLSMTERSKLDGARPPSTWRASAAVASRRPTRLPKLTSTDDLRTALRLWGSIPSGDLLSLEVIWRPDGNEDVLTSTDLVTLYPELQAL